MLECCLRIIRGKIAFPSHSINSMSNESIIQNLQERLLQIDTMDVDCKETPFDKLVDAVLMVSECDVCSLGGIINVPSEDGNFQKHVSLVARSYRKGLTDLHHRSVDKEYPFSDPEDFIHELGEGGFTYDVLYETNNGFEKREKTFHVECICKEINHKSQKALKLLYGSTWFCRTKEANKNETDCPVIIGIAIPCYHLDWETREMKDANTCKKRGCQISDQCKNNQCRDDKSSIGNGVDLVINLIFPDGKSELINDKDLLCVFVETVRVFTSRLHVQYTDARKQRLLGDLMQVVQDEVDKNTSADDLFMKIIERRINGKPTFDASPFYTQSFNYEDASCFIWSYHDNSYHYLATTANDLYRSGKALDDEIKEERFTDGATYYDDDGKKYWDKLQVMLFRDKLKSRTLSKSEYDFIAYQVGIGLTGKSTQADDNGKYPI